MHQVSELVVTTSTETYV